MGGLEKGLTRGIAANFFSGFGWSTAKQFALPPFAATSTFTKAGQARQLGSPDLDADKDGTRVTVVPEGILVLNSADNKLSLAVTQIDDKTAAKWRAAA